MKGFTLLESLVAVSILTLAIIGPIAAANHAILATRIARDQLIASYLAQEGIEYVRTVRDDAYLALYPGDTSDAWTNFNNAAGVGQCNATDNPSQACTFDSRYGLSPCSLAWNCTTASKLYLGADGMYTRDSNETSTSLFSRTIQVIDVSLTDKRIISKVSWSYHGTPYSVTIDDHLTQWQ